MARVFKVLDWKSDVRYRSIGRISPTFDAHGVAHRNGAKKQKSVVHCISARMQSFRLRLGHVGETGGKFSGVLERKYGEVLSGCLSEAQARE